MKSKKNPKARLGPQKRKSYFRSTDPWERRRNPLVFHKPAPDPSRLQGQSYGRDVFTRQLKTSEDGRITSWV